MNGLTVDFPESRTYSKDDLKKTQDRLLEMAKVTASILEKNGFRYFIAFGTLLGAVRHDGFIPWDDDFDMFLFDDEYDDAISCLRENLPKDIIVHNQKSDDTYYAAWSKLRDANSVTYSSKFVNDNKHKYRGINLDLYRLKTSKNNLADSFIKRENIEFLVRKHDARMMSDEEYNLLFTRWCKEYVDILSNTNNMLVDEEDDLFIFVYLVKKMKKGDIFPLKKHIFEDTEFFIPNNPGAFLEQAYGNYMEYPAYEKRVPNCEWVKFL